MGQILTLLAVLAFLVLILRLATSSRNGFSLVSAMQPSRSFTGDALGRLLSLVVISSMFFTGGGVVPTDVLARYFVPVLIGFAVGLALVPHLMERLLSVVAIALTLTTLGHNYGPAAPLGVLVLALLAVWITGFVRGFR
jgi:hypothetical protein